MTANNTLYSRSESRYRFLISPYMDYEKRQLQDQIDNNEPLIVRVWRGTVLSDFLIYDYCTEHKIPYSTREVSLNSTEEAIAWICSDQLDSRLLPDEMKWYLIGKRCLTEHVLGIREYSFKHRRVDHKKHTFTSKYNHTLTQTRERIAKEYNISIASVIKYERYANAVDSLSEIREDLAYAIISGKIMTSYNKVLYLSTLPAALIQAQADQILSKGREPVPETDLTQAITRRRAKKTHLSFDESMIAIKDMPAYDPDAEIVTLTLTIPSWKSSIERVMGSSDFRNCTNTAGQALISALKDLINSADRMITVTRESYHE